MIDKIMTQQVNQLMIPLEAEPVKESQSFFYLFQKLVTENSCLANDLIKKTIKLVKNSKIKNIYLVEWAIRNNCPKLIHRLTKNGSLEQSTDEMNASTLCLSAAANGQLSMIDLLITQGANVDAVDNDRNTWLHQLLRNEKFVGDEQQLQWMGKLIARYPNLLDQLHKKNERGSTPLHIAAALGKDSLVILFIKHGADKEAVKKDNLTPLGIAAANCQLSTIDLLITQGANVDALDEDGETWLQMLAKNNEFPANPEQIEWLKEKIKGCFDLSDRNSPTAQSLMQSAALNQNYTFVAVLESLGWTVDNLSAFCLNRLEGQVVSSGDNAQKIDIGQNHLNKKIKKYLLFYVSEEELKQHSAYDEKGLCKGYSLMFGYYASRGKMDEFFHALEQISLWDETEASLKNTSIYPELASQYSTIGEFFRFWTDHIFLFQAGRAYFKSADFDQNKFVEKYQIVKKDDTLTPVFGKKHKLCLENCFTFLLSQYIHKQIGKFSI